MYICTHAFTHVRMSRFSACMQYEHVCRLPAIISVVCMSRFSACTLNLYALHATAKRAYDQPQPHTSRAHLPAMYANSKKNATKSELTTGLAPLLTQDLDLGWGKGGAEAPEPPTGGVGLGGRSRWGSGHYYKVRGGGLVAWAWCLRSSVVGFVFFSSFFLLFLLLCCGTSKTPAVHGPKVSQLKSLPGGLP